MTHPAGAVREATSLLGQIADTALDDDYYVFRGSDAPRTRWDGAWVAVLIVLFAIIMTAAAVQTREDRPATELERRTLAQDIEARRQVLESRQSTASELRDEVESLRASAARVDPRTEDLRLVAADVPAEGPGIVATASGSPDDVVGGRISDNDLQLLVNGLWYAGAEAIAVNGNRLGSLSSIRTAGDAITVNFRSIGPPYTVIALGDPDTLTERFSENQGGAYWEARAKSSGLRLSMTPSSEVSVPAVPAGRLDLKHATALEVDR
ncbi:DUF881 domain-containing protein [Aeromicrobium terrae]|uniref:DUF881 domain-containing protein n=1 Tax=Aeromicrobium terrae TaxID=2498846 RepID=A0A5C8NP23_9ACTN|nr:DUF881 domain-containing protein [Aeromicrobium terrae]TXL63052.1 DUF881 domain-containing protein [Aeromicrobium terrae]